MATELQNPTDQSTTSLVAGIIDDMQDLVKQQVQLTRKEITEEVHKASEAAQLYALGGAVLFFGLFIGGLALVHLIHWASAPAASDPARIPLWACHAIVGGPLILIGGILAWMGRNKLASIHPLHNVATEALKDNVKWVTNSK
jgi:predicted ribosome-associated RNA-binding protein Tma20